MWKGFSCLPNLVLLTVLCGCGDLPSLVPASGTVTLDGKPLPDAEISFHTLGKTAGPGSLSFSDHEGKFHLRTSGNDGAAVGEYQVTVIRYGREDGTPLASEEIAVDFPPIMINILPKQYETMEQTPLKVSIGEEGNESIKLELVSSGDTSAAGAE